MQASYRRVAIVLGLLLGWLALSGLALAVFDIGDPQQGWAMEGGGPGVHASAAPIIALPTDRTVLTDALNAGVATVRRSLPEAPLKSVELRMQDGALQSVISAGSASPRRLTLSASGAVIDNAAIEIQNGQPVAAPAVAFTTLHERFETWHRMYFAGRAGLYLSFLGGLTLIVAVFRALLRTLRKPLPALQNVALTVAAVLLLHTAVTGMLLAGKELSLNWSGQSASSRDVPARALPESDLGPLLLHGYGVARAMAPNHLITALFLDMQADRPRLRVDFGGSHGGAITIDATSGERLAGPPGPSGAGARLDTYQFFKRLHRGDFVGSFYGRYLSVLAGLCLMALCLSVLPWRRRQLPAQ